MENNFIYAQPVRIWFGTDTFACAAHPLMQNNPVRMDEAALQEIFEKLR